MYTCSITPFWQINRSFQWVEPLRRDLGRAPSLWDSSLVIFGSLPGVKVDWMRTTWLVLSLLLPEGAYVHATPDYAVLELQLRNNEVRSPQT